MFTQFVTAVISGSEDDSGLEQVIMREASKRGLKGFVKRDTNGAVTVEAESNMEDELTQKHQLQDFINWLEMSMPLSSNTTVTNKTWSAGQSRFIRFTVN